jgi:glucose/arabinose dehydrogenase
MSDLQQEFNVDQLLDFDGKGKYSDPEFGWHLENLTTAVAPTAVEFLESDRFGDEYENDMLVANFDHGHLYRFDLNKDRTSLSLSGILSDKLSNGTDDNLDNTVAKFPGGITDVQIGPDGYIYLVSLSALQGDCDREQAGCGISGGMKGAIFRIVPNN